MGDYNVNACLLVGKPNAGKSSLFNQLTGLNQKVGNFSGVTVAQKKGFYKDTSIIDLPGLESLVTTSPEALLAKNELLSAKAKNRPVLFVANGLQIYSSLLLFSQIADLQIPAIVAINFSDEMERNSISIDIDALQNQLGCKVCLINSRNGNGIDKLKALLNERAFQTPHAFNRSQFDELKTNTVENNFEEIIQKEENLDAWKIDHNRRKQLVSSLLDQTVSIPKENIYLEKSNEIDKILLHPIIGLGIFLGILYLVFQSVFYLASFPMDWIDGGMLSLSSWLSAFIGISWLNALVTDAIIPGITGVVIFVPQIAILFLFIGLLEQIGYMSRISFIADNFLRKFGLSGHSVVPLISSWACAIPAIMSTRIIEDPKERFAVIMASPLMTCSARLPVYSILIAILFPFQSNAFFNYQGLALLVLYLLGVVATLLVAWLVTKYSSTPKNTNWALELPLFRMPAWKNLWINVYNKTKSFVVQAGKIIFMISILLWLLSAFSPKNDAFIEAKAEETQQNISSVALEYSYLGYAGKTIEPIIKPLGYDWKIGIALLSSFAAREVFVGTLSTIYSIESENEESITQRLMKEKDRSGKPRFNTATSVSLLLFYVFAMQCMSTLAIVIKETGSWRYAMYQLIGMTGLAYFSAFLAYQLLK